MFVSPFTASLACDAAIIVVYIQRPPLFGGTPWFSISSHTYDTEIVDIVWLAILRVLFLLPHFIGFLKRRRLRCPSFQKSFVFANAVLVLAKIVVVIVYSAPPSALFYWWLLLALSAASVIAQWGCLYHLRSTMPTPRYKTIFIGSRLDARLLGDPFGAGAMDLAESEAFDGEDLETGERGGREETEGGNAENMESRRKWRRSIQRDSRLPTGGSFAYRTRQDSALELVDYFAERMQNARATWGTRVQALQKRWQASFLRGDWGVRGGRSAIADRDAALRLTFGLIVRMYAYEDTLDDLRVVATQDPYCLEAFAPQFVSFLVWDSYYMSGQLEAWLLARCAENLYFAHALEFSLRSSCLPASSTEVADGGEAGGEGSETSAVIKTLVTSAGIDAAVDESSVVNEVIDKGGRRAVELLLEEIASQGEQAARRLAEAALVSAHGRGQEQGQAVFRSGSSSASVAAAAIGALEAAGSRENPETGSFKQGSVELYRQTVDFLTRLANIATSLTPLSKTERTSSLRSQLAEVEKEFLAGGGGEGGGGVGGGERLVYVPIGDRHHRVVAVHPADSFAFSTKERAPCFVCLEVVGAREPPGRFPIDVSEVVVDVDDLEDVRGPEAVGGGRLSGRARALRQWLPRSIKFKRRFRFVPGGREWMLSLWKDEEGDHDGDEGENKAELTTGAGIPVPEGRRFSVGERMKPSSKPESRGGHQRGSRSSGDMESGQLGASGETESGNKEEKDDYYRLLSEERAAGGRSGAGGEMSLSDAREWWAKGSASEKAWGLSHDDDDDGKIGDEQAQGQEGETSVEEGRWERGSTAAEGGGRAERLTKATSCSECGAEGGEPCRAGCPMAGAGGGRKSGEFDTTAQPNVLFNELWRDKSDKIRRVSPWANEPGWRLLPVIVKSNDDLRQEQLASQLLFTMQRILRAERVKVWLRPYDIVALSADSGIIEAIPDTISLDALRKYRSQSAGEGEGGGDGRSSKFSLTGFFEARFGNKGTEGFRKAQRRFIESLAAYSIACYLLQIKDRHNGNILLDAQGRVIHIDFGFILANSPGGNFGFESAPFKLTNSFIGLMGGTRSRCFRDFRKLCVDTFLALRRSSQEIVLLVEMMASGNETLPCFQGPGGGAAAAADLAERFKPDLNDPACEEFVHKLVRQSVGSWSTAWYDKYQRFWVGIY